MRITPLDPWIAGRIGEDLPRTSRLALETHQLRRLCGTLTLVADASRFYRGRLPRRVDRLADLAKLPFTTAADLRLDPLGFVCGSAGRINRIVTLEEAAFDTPPLAALAMTTSGTTGAPKRVAFTAADQELTVDFFSVGMSTFTRPGDRVAILLPGSTPGSVGDLLATAVSRIGASPLVHGPVLDPRASLRRLIDDRIDVAVGVPTHLLSMARFPTAQPIVRAALASTDHLPDSIVRAVEDAWGCTVYDHYGMTEMGLGGGVECEAREGYHLREADLIFEIVDPTSGEVVPAGQSGEVVVTTLTRTGMPLVRYRTGDVSRVLTGTCRCGSDVLRLERVRARLDGRVPVGGLRLTMAELDDALFPLDEIVGFDAVVSTAGPGDRLTLSIRTCGRWDPARVGSALIASVPRLADVDLRIERTELARPVAGKRRIIDLRQAS